MSEYSKREILKKLLVRKQPIRISPSPAKEDSFSKNYSTSPKKYRITLIKRNLANFANYEKTERKDQYVSCNDLQKFNLDDTKRLKIKIAQLISKIHVLNSERESYENLGTDRLKRVNFQLDGLTSLQLMQIYFRLNVEYEYMLRNLNKFKMSYKLKAKQIHFNYKSNQTLEKAEVTASKIFPVYELHKKRPKISDYSPKELSKSLDQNKCKKIILKSRQLILEARNTINLPKIPPHKYLRRKNVSVLKKKPYRNERLLHNKSANENEGQMQTKRKVYMDLSSSISGWKTKYNGKGEIKFEEFNGDLLEPEL